MLTRRLFLALALFSTLTVTACDTPATSDTPATAASDSSDNNGASSGTADANVDANAGASAGSNVNVDLDASADLYQGTMVQYRERVNQVISLRTRGRNTAAVYGSDIYTDDSDLGAAAVHAGVLENGEEGVVRVRMLPGQSTYSATTRNGVTSLPWTTPWLGSFSFEK